MDHALVLDTSNNDPITAAGISQSGACAVYSKATEGTSFKDGTYASQRAAARDCHVPFGAYVFLHQDSKGSEADYFIEYAQPKRWDLLPVIDAEVKTGASYRDIAKRTFSCARRLEHLGYPCMIYSGAYFYLSMLKEYPALKQRPVWEADYPGRYTRWSPALTAKRIKLQHGVTVKMWQWTDHFQVGARYYDASRLFVPVNSLRIANNL